MSGWDGLIRELDLWQEAGLTATLWWRDDDASEPSAAFDLLLAARRAAAVPLALAVIPGRASEALASRLAGDGDVAVLQHGWLHLNHAPPGEPKAEIGAHRPAAYVLGELARGKIALDRLFGAAWLRVLVPPYNRIAAEVARGLPLAGYDGLSTFNARRAPIPGLVQVNTHCDIMNWTTRGFVGEAAALGHVAAHLQARRTGVADREEATGFLTHHLAHDAAAWKFIDAFLDRIAGHAAVAWRPAEALFDLGATSCA